MKNGIQHGPDPVLSDDEARAILKAEGIDPDASLGRLMTKLDNLERAEEAARSSRFAKAEVERQRFLARLDRPTASLSPAAARERLTRLKGTYPELRAHFRDLETVSDEDVLSLLAEIEELVSLGKK